MTATTSPNRIVRRIASAAALAGVLAAVTPAVALPPPPPPPVNEPPVAAMTVTPNPAVVNPIAVVTLPIGPARSLGVIRLGTLVNFDASASTDDVGIVKYEWDLDSNGTFEKTTTTPTTSRRYSEPGVLGTAVRVTDGGGKTSTKTVALLLHTPPAARITASRTVVLPGDGISLSSATSSDDSGPIQLSEWDLDGNGTFEKTGTEATTSFGGVGTHTVALRVTDKHGAKSTATVQIRVHKQPTAAFVTRPVTPGVGQLATLDASGSEDDGSIARYQWDLDGDGTYETDTAAVPTTTRTFTTAGPAKVGLKVTDNDGSTAETTRTIQVAPKIVITDTTAPALRPLRTGIRLIGRGRVVKVTVSCPASESSCTVALRLRGTRGTFRGVTVAQSRTRVAGGTSAVLRATLTKKAAASVRKGRVLRATAVITATDAAGNQAVTRTAVRIGR